ncbi:MAG: serine/threonine-protein kinase [Gaiellaceae bacterium]
MPARTDITLPSRYTDVRPIAHGGMGEIVRATDQELGRDVAVKVLAERFAENDQLRLRFKREALAAARLSGNHNIVTIFDVGEHDGRPMIVMEYVAGGSLEQRIDGGNRVEPSQALDWLEQAAAAIDAAHEAGIVHRDVKPGNLLLDDRDQIKVADFGIASSAGMDSFTQTGTILGTAGYLSPEQARGEKATAASDVYALGVVAWELLTGRRPFAADSPTAEAAAHANAPISSVHAANPALPRTYDAIFERALAKDPADRYPKAAELVGELRRALHDDAGDTGWIEPPPRTRATRVAPEAHGPERRWLVPALLLVALVAGGVLAAVLATRDRTAAPVPPTVIHTVTRQGQTITQTVTTAPAAAPTTATASAATSSSGSGASLNNAGYSKMKADDYAGALPLLEQAVQKLSGTGSLDEAYADYNLAYTRLKLGQCTDVLALLERSKQVQGHRSEIDALRRDAKACK